MRKLSVLLIACLALAGACSNKNGPSANGSPTPSSTGAVQGDAGVTVSTTLRVKPVVQIPDSSPPSQLMYKDIAIGNGAVAGEHSSVVVHYVGISWSTKKQFDASWDRGSPFPFVLNDPTQPLIQGWEMLVPGMKAGGRRLLIIPAQYGYGASGQGPDIGPNETLVFVIDLLSVSNPSASPSGS